MKVCHLNYEIIIKRGNSYKKRQQTPKPAAHEPSVVPPWSLHSVLLKQTPVKLESVLVVHSALGKVTTANNDNTPTK